MFGVIRVSGFDQKVFQGWNTVGFVNIGETELSQYKKWFGCSGYQFYYLASLSPAELFEVKQTIPEINSSSDSVYNLSNACHYN